MAKPLIPVEVIYDRALESIVKSMKLKEIHDSVIGGDHVHEWTIQGAGGELTIDYVTPQGEKRGPAKLYIFTTAK